MKQLNHLCEVFDLIEIPTILNTVGESIIVADTAFNICWFNKSAHHLLKRVGPSVHIHNPDKFIGMNLSRFHGEKQRRILEEGQLPYEAHIKLFNRFSANIYVDAIVNKEGTHVGYILTWKDVTEFEDIIQGNTKALQSLYTPIIETTMDCAILVALTGIVTEDRIQHTKDAILVECAKRQAEYVLFDFTGIQEEVDDTVVYHLDQIACALRIMGSEAIFVGLKENIVIQFITKGLTIKVKTFQSFKQGMQFVFEQKGYELRQK